MSTELLSLNQTQTKLYYVKHKAVVPRKKKYLGGGGGNRLNANKIIHRKHNLNKIRSLV